MKRVLALVVVLSAAKLTGQSEAPPRVPAAVGAPTAPTGAVTGRVVATPSNDPIRNARVRVDDDPGVPAVFTDQEGRFELAAVPPGPHSLSVLKTGFAPLGAGNERARPIDVQAGATVVDADIHLEPAAAITGRVLDDLGAPVALMTVVAERIVRAGPRADYKIESAAETDDTGAYRLFGLSAGEFIVATAGSRAGSLGTPIVAAAPIAAGSGVHKYYPRGSTARAEAQTFRLAPGEELAGLNFSAPLPPAPPEPQSRSSAEGVINGRVRLEDGVPARRARVQLSSAEHLFAPYLTLTDDDGQFEFRHLPPGAYLVSAAFLGSAPIPLGQRNVADRGTRVVLGRRSSGESVELTLPKALVISGRVVDEYGDAVASASVRVEQIRFQNGRRRLVTVPGVVSRQTDDRGRYRIFGLRPGRYVIAAVVGQPVFGWATADLPGYARTYYPGTPVPREAQHIEISLADDALNVDIPLVRGRIARVTGTAQESSGKPFEGVVALMPSFRSGAIATPPLSCRTTKEGAFEFANLPPGEYVLQASKSLRDSATEGEFASAFVTVDGTDVASVVLKLTVGSSIAGRVIFEGENPPPSLADLQLSAIVADPDLVSLADNPAARAQFGEDGTFEMHGVVGARRLQLMAAPSGWSLKAILVNGADVTDEPLLFSSPEQSVGNVEVVLTRGETEITGEAADDQGRPLRDGLVIAFATDPARWYAHSRYLGHATPDEDGAFAVHGLPPGDYYVAAVEDGSDVVENGALDDPELLERLMVGASPVTVRAGEGNPRPLRVSAR